MKLLKEDFNKPYTIGIYKTPVIDRDVLTKYLYQSATAIVQPKWDLNEIEVTVSDEFIKEDQNTGAVININFIAKDRSLDDYLSFIIDLYVDAVTDVALMGLSVTGEYSGGHQVESSISEVQRYSLDSIDEILQKYINEIDDFIEGLSD